YASMPLNPVSAPTDGATCWYFTVTTIGRLSPASQSASALKDPPTSMHPEEPDITPPCRKKPLRRFAPGIGPSTSAPIGCTATRPAPQSPPLTALPPACTV